ncbi:MAG TPA: ABC transporter ATP-binding protein [Candidatus Hydrogenedentes bacterium]|nr:ABC transporter ATP-binding protein [Candidatus Hydrogenedentota bacterium]HOS02248.1 ABC transporter ATP-binding protein [Candidatus Hydrogenedentota bacterium]
MDAIVTHDLTKTYQSHVGRGSVTSLDGLNLAVQQNEVFGFLGKNGAGKTTTIKLLCSLLRPTRGTASVMGFDARSRKARQRIGYLPENPYFYEYLNPRETLDFYGQLQGLDRSERAAEWLKLSECLDLATIADQRVRGFSKGMRQRLGFAVALVGDPPALILDEPMSGLDPMGRRMIRELILRLRDEGKTIFFSSHVLGDVEQICDRVGILVKGKLVVQGRIEELIAQRFHKVEVILHGLNETAAAALAADAKLARVSEAGRHFVYDDLDSANEAVRAGQAAGAKLVEFTPVRDSLEDYFMRHQEIES